MRELVLLRHFRPGIKTLRQSGKLLRQKLGNEALRHSGRKQASIIRQKPGIKALRQSGRKQASIIRHRQKTKARMIRHQTKASN